MSLLSFPSDVFNYFLRKIFALKETHDFNLGNLKRILLVCPHYTLNDLIISTSLFRALKEKYPNSDLIVLVNDHKYKEIKNNLIDEFLILENLKLLNPIYIISFFKKLRAKFDVCIVPITHSSSSRSDYIARISNSKIRIGINSLDGKINKSNFCFDKRIDLNFCKHPDTNISERVLEIVKPFRIDTKDLSTTLVFNETNLEDAKSILSKIKKDLSTYLIGLDVSSEKEENIWSLNNFIELIKKLNSELNCVFYLMSHDNDNSADYVNHHSNTSITIIKNKTITEKAAIVLLTDLFITNDSSLMHIAGTTTTPQISLFGLTNPFNWAPCGKNKIFLRKSDLIDEITVDEVLKICKILLQETR